MSSVNKKILGIDYGDFSIGLAIWDVDLDFIYPYKTIFREKANILRKSIREIVDIIKNEKISEVVVGYPLNLDGTEGDRVKKVKDFSLMLENKLKLIDDFRKDDSAIISNKDFKSTDKLILATIHFQDERLTTKEAREILSTRGIKKSDEKKYIDQVASEIILSDYRQSLSK